MKLLIHMNMPSGKNDGTHQLILEMPSVAVLADLPFFLKQGYLYGTHLIYDRVDNNTRTWSSRGTMIINVAHIGKIAEYYEG
jgi:hypothetical protein